MYFWTDIHRRQQFCFFRGHAHMMNLMKSYLMIFLASGFESDNIIIWSKRNSPWLNHIMKRQWYMLTQQLNLSTFSVINRSLSKKARKIRLNRLQMTAKLTRNRYMMNWAIDVLTSSNFVELKLLFCSRLIVFKMTLLSKFKSNTCWMKTDLSASKYVHCIQTNVEF